MKLSREALQSPVSGLSLAVFRIAFGLILSWNSLDYIFFQGKFIQNYLVNPPYHPKFPHFEWVTVWPEVWMGYVHFSAMLLMSLLVMFGLFYRFAIVAFTLLFAYVFYLDMALYLNHYYLVIVVAVLMTFLPMNRALSIDRYRHPEWKNTDVPLWSVWAARTQIEIVLLYAGIVKVKHDWLHLEPLGTFLRSAEKTKGHFFGDLVYQDWFIALGSYGVIALHLIGAPLLLYRRTRLWVFLVYSVFHLVNSYTFHIGIFPYFTIAATLIFFDPTWPKMLAQNIQNALDRVRAYYASRPPRKPLRPEAVKALFAAVIVWLIFQAVFPLRAAIYPGDSAWTEEGHYYAWRMMLDHKRLGAFRCKIRDPETTTVWEIDPANYLTKRQRSKVAMSPPMILNFAHYLEDLWRADGYADVAVYCTTYVGLNGRKPALLIDPSVDLTQEKWGIMPEKWIMPMTQPFRHWKDRP